MLSVLSAGLIVALAPPAAALGATLDVEFDTGLTGSFAAVTIVESGGDLDFSITLDPSLGPDADLEDFYFNLVGTGFTGLAISTTDTPQTAYTLLTSPSVEGGAGSSFDFGVNFGDGAGPAGNGTLQTASFSLSADQALVIADLLESSTASGGTVMVQMALHAQSTALISGQDSETVGGVIPEPSTLLLVAIGLGGLALRGRLAA